MLLCGHANLGVKPYTVVFTSSAVNNSSLSRDICWMHAATITHCCIIYSLRGRGGLWEYQISESPLNVSVTPSMSPKVKKIGVAHGGCAVSVPLIGAKH